MYVQVLVSNAAVALLIGDRRAPPQVRMNVCESHNIRILTALAHVLHIQRDVVRARCAHANSDDVAIKAACLAAVSTADPCIGLSDARLLKHN